MTSNRAAVSWRPAPEEPHLKSPARKRRVGGRHQPISPEGPAKEAPSSPVDSPCLFGMENSAPIRARSRGTAIGSRQRTGLAFLARKTRCLCSALTYRGSR